MRLNNKLTVKKMYKLDTGAGKTYIRLQDFKRLKLSKKSLKAEVKASLGGKYKNYNAILNCFSTADGLAVFKRNTCACS